MSEVKRYTLWMVSESGCELEPYSEESPDGLYVHHADYAAIEAECQRLRQAMLRLVTTHCAAATKNNATDAELEQYLSAGIAQLEAERERLRAQVSALKSDANSWQSGYNKGREDGAKAAEAWKAQHARDSAELRRLCSERDALRQQLAERDAQIERLQMQLAACGVVALANTPGSAGEARQMHPDYMSASCSDVADAVDREIAMRQQRDNIAQILRDLVPGV